MTKRENYGYFGNCVRKWCEEWQNTNQWWARVLLNVLKVFKEVAHWKCIYRERAMWLIAVRMEAIRSSEMAVNINHTTWCNTPEDSRLQIGRICFRKLYDPFSSLPHDVQLQCVWLHKSRAPPRVGVCGWTFESFCSYDDSMTLSLTVWDIVPIKLNLVSFSETMFSGSPPYHGMASLGSERMEHTACRYGG